MILSSLAKHAQPLLLLAALVAAGVAMRGCMDARAALTDSGLEIAHQKRVNDSTVAQLTVSRAQNDAYAGLLDATNVIHGALIAAVKVRVAPRDTVILHDTLLTALLPDSTRTATFRDSTFAGTITGTVTAPPCCQPLAVDFRIHRPAFEPSIGFVQRGSRTVAVVVWQGEQAEIATPPFSLIPPPPKRFVPYAELWVSPTGATTVTGGAALRLGQGVSLFGRAEQHLEVGEPLRAGVGIRKEW
jgi:hypothetical protein